MTSSESPEDTAQEAALDDDAAPGTGSDPDTPSESAADPAVSEEALTEAVEADGEDAGNGRTELDGPALTNPEMHRATDDLQSSEAKSEQAREFAGEVAASQRDSQD